MIKVDAHYTSQMCPKCGHTHKLNRDHKKHCFCCRNCGYRSNDDRIGAMNIYMRGVQFIQDSLNELQTTIRVNKFDLMGCGQSPHDVTTTNLRLVKNVVEPQKFDKELRVSYKPTAFRRWLVDSRDVWIFCRRNFLISYLSRTESMIV